MAFLGQLYANPTKLSVRFYNECVHKEDGSSFGRLEGLHRQALAQELQGEACQLMLTFIHIDS